LGTITGHYQRRIAGSSASSKYESHEALIYINKRLDAKGLTGFDPDNPLERTAAVASTLDASIERLPKTDLERFYQLGIFPEDEAIPVSNLCSLWDLDELDTEDLCERLARASLLQDYDGLAIRLHDVVRAHLLPKLEEPARLHTRLIDGWGDLFALPNDYAWRNLAYHLIQARQPEMLRSLLLNFQWLQTKLDATNIHALVGDGIWVPEDDAIRLLMSALRNAAHILVLNKTQLWTQVYAR